LDQALKGLIELALAEDLGAAGDVTSIGTLSAEQSIHGRIIAKENGVIAGLKCVQEVYAMVDPSVVVNLHVQDGDAVTVGTLVCSVEGPGRSILTGERTALNFLQRLSGVASLTARYVAAVAGTSTRILDTRKTTPGWRALEKYAVRMGGGQNHRTGLYDMVLIKDNHIAAAGGIAAAVERVRETPAARDLLIEVEVETLEQLQVALGLYVDRILLDNMDTATMKAAVEMAAGRVALEASGNMTLDRVAEVAATGVDFISVGALTHSARALDLSMRLQIS
jgi:nicotinate-nucleotide pyrophosphorylase (carboxylating)